MQAQIKNEHLIHKGALSLDVYSDISLYCVKYE